MDTLLIIRQNYSNFTTVEKKIADYIFEVGEKMLEKSAQEVASEIGSSSAALVRFSRKLGYDGFSQLKQKLSASYAVHEDDEDYYKEVNDSETPSSIKNKLKVRVNHMVETTNAALSDDEIMAAVALIDEAESIFVFGIGASSMVAQDIFQKFSRIGKQVFFIQDAHLFVSSLSISDRKTIFIGISMKGETKEVIELARVVKGMKIPIIAITSREESTLGQMSDYILHSVSGEDYQMHTAATMSLMAQLYVVDILFYMFVSEHFTESYDKLEKTRDAIKLLEEK
ncbi:Sialic acid utilization regulator, RpiR family [Lactococcus cremoris subsp. cremoris A76]|uniref:MurR/RpiR family transcriptional regulator n=1 Tax=Lactococcus lactis subsp. cremoris TaxID=1359 RepID=UPI000238C94B|nr:MurR/RpiR family transcriptional regulator [Lactococcus cremoris]AEU40427.1 Sialic acid utilization regulator, RpiR family [Lactococcus cremoris subsp. cremoris A76]